MSIMDLGNTTNDNEDIQWTCRAEMPCDESHILQVLRSIKGFNDVRIGPEGYIHFKTGMYKNGQSHRTYFTNKYPDMTHKEIVQGMFRHQASAMNKSDLHRAWQTMTEGMEPNEEWYKD